MRLLLQKVSQASVSVDGQDIASIGKGYLLFLGIMNGDTREQAEWLCKKVAKLRLWDSSDGPPDLSGIVRAGTINDRSLLEVGGSVLVVSQFTLAGSTEKGNRPDYTSAARPEIAEPLYETFVASLRLAGIKDVRTGRFGAMMEVALINDGPVTLMLER
jgi:D-tyrosyl-tRNA(Tyr) deacylase